MKVSKGAYCSAVNCSNNKGKNPELSFFTFPKDPERSKRWVINCRREDLLQKSSVYLNTNCTICTMHFEDNQFMNENKNSLIKTAVPSIFEIGNCRKKLTRKRKPPKQRNELQQNRKVRLNDIKKEKAFQITDSQDTDQPTNNIEVAGSSQKKSTPIEETSEIKRYMFTMDSHIEREQLEIRNEEDPLSTTEVQTEQHYMKCEIKSEPEPCDKINKDVDIHHGTALRSHDVGYIKTVSELIKYEIKTEVEEYEEINDGICIKEEIEPISNDIASMKTVSEVQGTQESLDKLCEESEDRSHEQKICENGESNVSVACNTFKTTLQNDKCGVHACDNTGVSVDSCDVYNNSFFDQNTRLICTQTTDKLIKCNICGKYFSQKSSYRKHMLVHSGEKSFTCDVCSRSFCRKYYLTDHMRIHNGEKPISCGICNKSFLQRSCLIAHKRVHKKEKLFTCQTCSKSFTCRNYLMKHTKIHINEKPSVCDICSKSFSHKSYLIAHLRIHRSEKPFTCHICNKSLSRKCTLNAHLQTHTNEKDFSCNICSKSFSEKSDLDSHMFAHKFKRLFTCDKCRKSFSRKSDLTRHLRVHTNEKPFACNFCGKSFPYRSSLSDHTRIHVNDRQFCNICNKSFSQKASLIRHKNTHKN